MPFLIDTHTHVNFNAFKEDSSAVLRRALDNNIWVIIPGSQFSTSQRAVQLAEGYSQGVYAAIGLHPIHLEARKVDVLETQSEATEVQPWMTFETKGEEFDYEKYKELGQSKKVVAIGECGLDYYYEPKGKARREAFRFKQKSVLAMHLKLAEELGLPVIFHCRKSHDDLLEFLKSATANKRPAIRGVIHCYTGNLVQAEKFYNLGLYFGFNGLIFKKVTALPDPKEIIANLPLERIVLETDSPYLVPPEAGTLRNEPIFVKYIAKEIARIKNISIDEVEYLTTQNAKKLFGLGKNGD